VTTFVDITEQRLRELDLANALKRARLAERAKSDFIDAMSHEVRTPLNGMLGVTQSLLRKDDTALPPRARSKVDLLHRSGLALKAIVDDALDISRLANDRLELTRSIYRPCVAVDDAARLYESMAQAKGVGFHAGIDIDPSLSALGDEVRVKQVLHNLLSNAVKFTASGAVGVAAHVETVTNRPEMVIVVRDTGIGVPAHFASRLGSSFARADNAAAAGASGAGLGLFLSREIAKRMGGRLDYAPNPGGGSAFEFRFPLELAESGPAATVPPPLQGLAPGLKVLVAEDNAMNQHVISLLLEQFDVDITFANNGAEGLKLAQSRRFDIALVDLYMPVMGGLELITQLRAWEADAQAPRTPIVCLSASVKDTSLRSVVDAGADAFVGKPIDFTEIVNVIREVTSKAATAH
jgi:CheY-like chemotaxis protein